jgi:hypothetical protein
VVFIVAAAPLILAVFCLLFAGFANPWCNIGYLMFLALAAYGMAFTATVVLAIGVITSPRRLPWVVGLLVSCAAVAIAQYAANGIARASRKREVRKALDAGLERDCRITFAAYQADPRLEKDGYIRVFRDSNEFESLPASIRMLNPIYVTVEDHPFGSDMPANVGLCKNGFGGFAFGVRVFVDGENTPEEFSSEKITPTVYVCQGKT